jgi:N-acetylneuraminic acid mutarotase
MRQINKSMKYLFFILSMGSIAIMSATLSSCGSSSTNTTATLAGCWDKKPAFSGVQRGNATSFVIQEKAYVVGGYSASDNKRLNDMYQFDPTNDSWIEKASFPGVARSQAVSFVLNNKGYVGTGFDDASNKLKDFYEYDPATDKWRKIADFIDGRYGAIAFSVSNRGFVGAGYNGNNKNDLWEYSPDGNTWTPRANLFSKRANASTFVIDNAAYVLGGTDNLSTVKEVEKYDPSTNTWTQKLKLIQRDLSGNTITQPLSREFAAAFAIDGFGYFTCGSTGGPSPSSYGDTWQYNPSKDTWTQYYSLNKEAASRYGAVSFAIGLNGYIATGASGPSRLDDCWVFIPTCDEGTVTGGNGL